MKKKIVIGVFFLLCFFYSLNAEVKQYYYEGTMGIASAQYLGIKKDLIPTSEIEEMEKMKMKNNASERGLKVPKIYECDKITKQLSFFIWSALDEYYYNDKEVYCIKILIGTVYYEFIVTITKKGNSLDWIGFYIDGLENLSF